MTILTTCRSRRTYDRPLLADSCRGLLPSYAELSPGSDPVPAFIDVVRTGLRLRAQQPGRFTRLTPFPLAEGLAWSRRGGSPAPGDYHGEDAYARGAWIERRVGAAFEISFRTLEPGFSVDWRIQIVGDDVLTAVCGESGIEIFEPGRLDTPIACAPTPTRSGEGADRRLRGLGYRRAGAWTHQDGVALTVVVADHSQLA